jgi:hypothetical protein
VEIINVRNWRIDNLMDERGTLHKPRIYLGVEITSKDNLVLEWYPWARRTLTLEQTDWTRWTDLSPIGEMPWNRIIQLNRFGRLMHRAHLGQLTEAQKNLLLAAESLLQLIYDFLGSIAQVNITRDLHLDRPGKGASITGARIMTPDEIAKERRHADALKWFRKTFDERLHPLTAGNLLRIFRENGMKASRVSNVLKSRYLIDIGQNALGSILARLQSQFPELCKEPYAESLPEPKAAPAQPRATPYRPRLLRQHPDPGAKLVIKNPEKLKIDKMGRPKQTP